MEKKYYDLSAAQRILFFAQKYSIHKELNNISTSVLVDAELDLDTLKQAISRVYERNDALRLRVVKVDKEMKQYFADYEEPDIEFLDFRGKTQEQMEKKLKKIARKPISILGKSMSKVYILRAYDGKWGIYFVVSHLIMDSWAITVFFKDVLMIYEALRKGTDMPKPLASYEKLLQQELNYRNTEAYKKARAFFEGFFRDDCQPIFTHVNGSSELERFRKKKKDPNWRWGRVFTLFTKANHTMLPCSTDVVEKMKAYCDAQNLPMQSLVLLAFFCYLAKVNTIEKNVLFHTVVARRATLAEKNTGGSRVHFMPFWLIYEGHETFRELSKIIQEKQMAVFRHAEIDPLEVMGMLKKKYNAGRFDSYATASVTFQPVQLTGPEGVKIETKWYGNGVAAQPFYLTVMDGDGTGGLKFYYEYQTHHISLETVKRLHGYMMKVIEAGIENDEITINDLLRIE